MDNLFEEVTKGRKRASKRSRKSKAETEEVIPRRRTRANTMTRQEIEEATTMFAVPAPVAGRAPSYSMSQPTDPEMAEASYGLQAQLSAYQTMTRSAGTSHKSSVYYSQPSKSCTSSTATTSGRSHTHEMPQTSTGYPTHRSHSTTAVRMSDVNRASDSSRTSPYYASQQRPHVTSAITTMTDISRAYSSHQRPHVTSTITTMSERSTTGMSPTQAGPGYAAQSQASETPSFHAMAERTRAATKMLRSRSAYAARQPAANPPAYTTTETPVHPTVSERTHHSSTFRPQPDHIPDNRDTKQPSVSRYNTRQGVHNLPVAVAPTATRYWIKPQNTNTEYKKSIIVQTEIIITQIEAKLLRILRAKQLEPTNVNIAIKDNEYTVTYNQVKDKKAKPNPINNILRSSDIIKSSLINFYNNAIEQGNVSEIHEPNLCNQAEYLSTETSNNENSHQVNTPGSTKDFLQNKRPEDVTENPLLKQVLLGNQKANDESSRATTNTTSTKEEVNQPKITIPQERCFQIPNMRQNQQFSNYFNPRYYQQYRQGPCFNRDSHSRHNYPTNFMECNPFLNPPFLPSGIRQSFSQYWRPRWF